jgi:hypothetical protein
MCPKLTEHHFTLPFGRKMRVSLAVHILSHSVAAGILTCVEMGRLPQDAKQTAAFLDKCNSLFDILNSSSICGLLTKSAVSAELLEVRIKQLDEFQEWVSGWKFVDQRDTAAVVERNQLKFQKGLVLTISAVKGLLQRLIKVLLRYRTLVYAHNAVIAGRYHGLDFNSVIIYQFFCLFIEAPLLFFFTFLFHI